MLYLVGFEEGMPRQDGLVIREGGEPGKYFLRKDLGR